MTPIQCRRARKRLGWSIEELAHRALRSPTVVGEFERGKKPGSTAVLASLRRAFGMDQRTADDGVPVWIITHLATGHRLPREFLSREAAVACVGTLAGLACWTMDDPGQMLGHPDAQLARRLVASAPGSRTSAVVPLGKSTRCDVEPR